MQNKTPFVPKDIAKLSAVLFSVSQQAFHLESLADYIESNIKVSLTNSKNDYRLIGVFENDVEGDSYIEQFRKHQKLFFDKTNQHSIIK